MTLAKLATLNKSTTHVIHEHVFSPEEARQIVEATIAAGYNFRVPHEGATNQLHYQFAMTTGQWEWKEANPIRLSDDWKLCSDGLHRLYACARSGVPLRALVLVGEEWRSGINSDRGRSRTVAQFLANAKIPNSSQLAAITAMHLSRLVAHREKVSLSYARSVRVTDAEIIAYIETNSELLQWVTRRSGAASRRGLNANGYGVFLLELGLTDMAMAEDFHADFIDETLAPADPTAQMRTQAVRRYGQTGKRANAQWTINNLVKAHNHRVVGDALLMWKAATWTDVRFPDGFSPEAQ